MFTHYYVLLYEISTFIFPLVVRVTDFHLQLSLKLSKTIRCIDIDLVWRPKTLVFDKYHKHIRFVCFITQSIWIVLSYRWNTHERENIYQNNVSFLLLNILNTIEDKINSKCKVSTVCHGNNADTIVPAALVVCLLIILPCEVVKFLFSTITKD